MKEKHDYLGKHFTITVLYAFVAGFITHLFGLVNFLHNYDDICVQPYGYGTGISSGRWLLTIWGYIADFMKFSYNLPLVNGLIFLLLLSLSAGLLVSTLNIQSKTFSVLIGMLFMVFPAATSAMLFKYTVPYYGFAILCSVASAWVIPCFRYGLLFSAILTALSLGIYQAYTPITVALLVLMLLQYTLSGEHDFKSILRRGLAYCFTLILGVLLYFLCLKVLLALTHSHLSTYQNVDNMGHIDWRTFPALVVRAFSSLYKLPRINYCGLATTRLLKLVYFAMGLYSVFLLICVLVTKTKKVSLAIISTLLCLVFPVAINFIVIMCPDSNIYTLMVYAFVLAPCFPIVIFELLPHAPVRLSFLKDLMKYGTALILSVIILSYSYEANVGYSSAYFANRQTENYVASIVTQVRMTEGFTSDKKWAFVGELNDPLLSSPWAYETRYGGIANAKRLLTSYSQLNWFENYIGYFIPQASSNEIQELTQTEEFRAMPCWPDQGSIKVIGDIVAIKFQEAP